MYTHNNSNGESSARSEYGSDNNGDRNNRGRNDGYSNSHQSNADYDPIYQNKVRAGKRTYFFDIKEGNRGRYLVLTESKRNQDGYYEKHKLMFFPEDAEKLEEAFVEAFKELVVGREESGLQYAPGGELHNQQENTEDAPVVSNPISQPVDETSSLKDEFTIEL